MKKFIVLLFLLPIVAFAQPKKVDLVGTFMIGAIDTLKDTTSKVIYTDLFGVPSNDSISFVVEYEINDSLSPMKYRAHPLLVNLADTLSYTVGGFNGKIKTTNYTALEWVDAIDEIGIHYSKASVFSWYTTKIQLRLGVAYARNEFPSFWHKRGLKVKIYKISK